MTHWRGAISGLQRLGLDVPEDISVVGMNDLPHAEFASSSLTTVHLPVQEIGVIALELLQDCSGILNLAT